MNIWKSLLAVCLLIAMFGCGASASKKANQEGAAKQLPRLCVTGTQLMNEQGDTVVLKGVTVMGGISFGLVSIMLLP